MPKAGTAERRERRKSMACATKAQRWNDWKSPFPVQAGNESLGRSVRWMQAGGEIAGPESAPRKRRDGMDEIKVVPQLIQMGGESLGRSLRRMQREGEIAAP